MMRALVTGATGFIGGALVRTLRARGWDVTALVRDPTRAERLGVALAPGDVVLRPTIDAAVRGHDAVFHLAAWYAIGVRDRARIERINVGGTENVLRAAADAGVPRIVYCSSVAALGRQEPGAVGDETAEHPGNHASLYEETKHRAHLVARALAAGGAPVTVAMPGATYGPGDRSVLGLLLRLYGRRTLPACPFQDAGLSWVHVDDVAEGIARAAECSVPGEEYVLGGDNETIRGMFRRAAPFTGIKPPRRLPDRMLRLALPFGPAIGRVLGREPDLLREGLASLRGSWMYSSARAERALGYAWRPIEEGIPETVRALAASPGARRRRARPGRS